MFKIYKFDCSKTFLCTLGSPNSWFKRNGVCTPDNKCTIVRRTALRQHNLHLKLRRESIMRTSSSTLSSYFGPSMSAVRIAVDQRFQAQNSSRSRLQPYKRRKKFNLERDNMQIYLLYKFSGGGKCDLLSRFGCRRQKSQKCAKNTKNRIFRDVCGTGKKSRTGGLHNGPRATFFVLCT